MRQVTATTWRFRPREHPDAVRHVQEAVTASPYRHVARVRLGAEDLRWVATHLVTLGVEVEVLEPAELRDVGAELAARLGALALGVG